MSSIIKHVRIVRSQEKLYKAYDASTETLVGLPIAVTEKQYEYIVEMERKFDEYQEFLKVINNEQNINSR